MMGSLGYAMRNGYDALISREDVLDYVDTWVAKGRRSGSSRIKLRVICPVRPIFLAPFDWYWEVGWGARWNAAATEEWEARLVKFVRN